jgi:hypothetical protein
MKFFRRTVGDSRVDHQRSEEILEETNLELVKENLKRYKSNWQQYETRMNNRMKTFC